MVFFCELCCCVLLCDVVWCVIVCFVCFCYVRCDDVWRSMRLCACLFDVLVWFVSDLLCGVVWSFFASCVVVCLCVMFD